jgi:Zn-dependent protease
MDVSLQVVISVVLQFAIVLFSLSVHESAHAWMADRLGDSTGRMLGRITLNPWPHVDVLGTIVLPIVLSLSGMPVFGWAKPVPVITRNFRHIKRDMALVGAAGPLSNLLLAILMTIVLGITMIGMGPEAFSAGFNLGNIFHMSPVSALEWVAMMGLINLVLASFNLIPLPPLDGSWVLAALLPPFAQPFFAGVQRLGPILLLILFFTRLINLLLMPILSILLNVVLIIPLNLLKLLLAG